jgi:3-isopropylmalate dehydratase small subunit
MNRYKATKSTSNIMIMLVLVTKFAYIFFDNDCKQRLCVAFVRQFEYENNLTAVC